MRLADEEIRWLRQFEGADYALENSGRYAETLEVLGRYLTPGKSVIDLGTYPGHLALLARRRFGVQVAGLSYAHTATFAKAMAAQGVTVHEVDIARADPPLADGSFDVALCTEIIEHLDRPLPLLVRANRLLRPGGILVLSTPNHASLKGRLNLLAGRATNAHLFGTRHIYQMSEWVHRREYTADELRRLLEPVGFTVAQTRFARLESALPGARARLVNLLRRVLYVLPSLRGGIIVVARKGADAAFTSLVPDRLDAVIRPAAAALFARPGEALELEIELENSGTSTWLTDETPGYGFVKLGAHLRDGAGRMLDCDFLHAPLPHDLRPEAKVQLPMRFSAPAAPGDYVLELELVNEGVSWFRDYGSPPVDVRLRVAHTAGVRPVASA